MHNIAICIPTYKRPLMLKKLIVSINDCNIEKQLINDINIIIVDNDIDKTAETTINQFMKGSDGISKIFYYNYPVKGLSNVRNELINKALLLNPGYLIFIDDDEYVTPNWLNELVKTMIVNNGDLTVGPVIPIFENNVSRYINCWFDRPTYLNNSKLDFIITGNLIINVKSLRECNIRFDPRFNKTGSEDSYFGIQMIKRGATIYWADNAIAYETISKNRANLKWLIQRWFRGSGTYTYVLKLEKEYFNIFKKIIVSIFYVIVGFISLLLILIPIRKKYWGIHKLTVGIGALAGFTNILYKEYK